MNEKTEIEKLMDEILAGDNYDQNDLIFLLTHVKLAKKSGGLGSLAHLVGKVYYLATGGIQN